MPRPSEAPEPDDVREPTQLGARVRHTRHLRGGYHILEADLSDVAPGHSPLRNVRPGRFVMLRGAWGRELQNPRAFSVLDSDADGWFSVLLKPYGQGTRRLCNTASGDPLMVTGPLGRGFAPARSEGATQLLVAGGVGLPPLHLQARRAAAAGLSNKVELLYGGRDRDDLVLLEDFEGWDVAMHLATEDGSVGERGYVTVALERRLELAAQRGEQVEILSCGPTPMLHAVRKIGLARGVQTWLCLEEEMACGFGVCLGCAVPVYGAKPYRYCCTDGPVFDAREVRW